VSRIPHAPLLLGLAGLLPFVWGVLTMYVPSLYSFSLSVLGPRLVGPYLQNGYGTVILSFMSGVLWGFATRTEGARAGVCYGLSVLPALWAFFMVGNGPNYAATSLAVGFIGLLMLDWQFSRWGLTPGWWMPLRLLLTGVVVLCLLPVVFL